MVFIAFILAAFVFVKTVSYGIYEWKQNQNKVASIIIFILSFVVLFFTPFLVYLR
ncbi:MAG TPA: hypothetical protein IAB70_02340 [Candidatus Merdicola faecigallinarum]|uniref:Uncharacterized protein n=1 Tax=Candidatus Merdicola faecigallinarum TaxID=2840862 RepID=A0A9D1M0Q9_9FIRM|nr:hypothetical protein [Candidatus Merdicola faecigallinarum]